MDRRTTRFEALYREHFGFVWAAARGLGTPESALPDVVQEVFVTAYRRLDAIEADRSPRGWLYAVSRRVAFRVRRTAARATRRELALRGASDDGGGESMGDEAVDLARLLDALEPPQREVLVMADLLGMSGPEMATQTGAPLDTVYSRLRLARGRLQRLARAELTPAIEAARCAPGNARARCWLALAPVVSKSAIATTGALGLAKLGLGAAAVVGGIAWFVSSPSPAVPSERRSAGSVEAPAPSEPTPPRLAALPTASAMPPQLAAPTLTTPTLTTPKLAAPKLGMSGELDASPTTAVGTGVRTPAAQAERGSPPAAPVGPSGIDAELVALETARARLDAGDPAGALASLAGTAGSDPKAQLADARGALRVRALCELGRRAEAGREGDALRRRFPASRPAATAKCDGL